MNCHCIKCIRCNPFKWNSWNPKDRSDLIGKFYDCICDPLTGGLSHPINRHSHKILDAVFINVPNHIYNGLALILEVGGKPGRSVYGCKEKHIKLSNAKTS